MSAAAAVHWRLWHWNEWSNDLLYAALQLRSAVFVVEQNCVFPDMDGLDPACAHLCGCDESGRLLAYARLLAPGVKYEEASIGRVVTARDARGLKLGRQLMIEALRLTRERHPGSPIKIGAQRYLEPFYGSLGFVTLGEAYLEDNIWHVDMRMAC
ncbi:GNAT family N-acetyltransferase [Nevskia sp.]|uniref:GNAT family N-acetyltransferase n=1 Tax=Nevskia sp. TaxID=1929292 RepID=UPI0025F1A26D|nr:GNAT family N-acetyltransferase [Nevskia sp.]